MPVTRPVWERQGSHQFLIHLTASKEAAKVPKANSMASHTSVYIKIAQYFYTAAFINMRNHDTYYTEKSHCLNSEFLQFSSCHCFKSGADRT